MSLNPLDRLISATLHSDGRRENRRAQSVKMNARFLNPEDAQRAMLRGELVKTLPIRRKVPKRPAGISARQWKRKRKLERKAERDGNGEVV